jgi:hypothetical protein
MACGLPAVVKPFWRWFRLSAAGLAALAAGAAFGQDAAPPADSKSGMKVVPYCIEPMDKMPEKTLALIDPQFRCEAGTHLKRQSRPTIVTPTGEETTGRPFVLRFEPPEKANAWFVRGFTTEPEK